MFMWGLFLLVLIVSIAYPDLAPGVGLLALIPPSTRRLFTVPFAASTTERVYSPDFPRALLSGLSLRLTGALTKVETAPGVLASTVLSLIRGIRILGDSEVIRDIAPDHLRVISHHILRGVDTNLAHITLGSDTAETFSARLELDFASKGMKLPQASYLPGHRYDQLTFEVDWGDYTSLIQGGTFTGTPIFSTPPKLEVWGEEIKDPQYRALDYLLLKYTAKVFSVNSIAQNETQFYLPVGEQYRGILMSQYTRNPDLPIITLCPPAAKISVKLDGSTRIVETTWEEQVQRNQSRYGIALPPGYIFLDFCEDGDLARALRTSRDMTLEVTADTAAVANAFLQFTSMTYKAAPRPR